ncbi:hypothetical protein FB451DRAFT_136094 [Mycena latifolia]|nr:hypothetical protein FB451DRAFT_136094 [Mycena latifolia]
MKDILSQVLSLVYLVLVPFIPNNIMRYTALVLVSLLSAAYLANHNSPTCQIVRLAASIKEIDTLLAMAMNECTTDPRFLFEARWKLTELKYAVSNLNTRLISTKYIAWTKYAHHLGRLSLSIHECRREIDDLRAVILLALECARQQQFEEDINRMTATLLRTEGPSGGRSFLRMRASRLTRPASESRPALLRFVPDNNRERLK